MPRFHILIALALLAPVCADAQKKIPVEVSVAGETTSAVTVAQALRHAIRSHGAGLALPEHRGASSEAYGMRLTTELARPRIRLNLAGTDPATGATAIAVTVLYDSPYMPLGGAHIRSVIVTCGADTAACARQILGHAQASMEWLRERWPSIWNTL